MSERQEVIGLRDSTSGVTVKHNDFGARSVRWSQNRGRTTPPRAVSRAPPTNLTRVPCVRATETSRQGPQVLQLVETL